MVAILFALEDSIYKQLPGCEVYDINRDATTFAGGMPVVAHPPCRAWSKLRAFANPPAGEKSLAVWAVQQVRENGGVLEHPAHSSLWSELNLPKGIEIDQYGGFTLSVDQFWWGHRAKKSTWLYVVGLLPSDIPAYPLRMDAVTHTVCSPNRGGQKYKRGKKEMPKPERLRTPEAFAKWLVTLALKTKINGEATNVGH